MFYKHKIANQLLEKNTNQIPLIQLNQNVPTIKGQAKIPLRLEEVMQVFVFSFIEHCQMNF